MEALPLFFPSPIGIRQNNDLANRRMQSAQHIQLEAVAFKNTTVVYGIIALLSAGQAQIQLALPYQTRVFYATCSDLNIDGYAFDIFIDDGSNAARDGIKGTADWARANNQTGFGHGGSTAAQQDQGQKNGKDFFHGDTQVLSLFFYLNGATINSINL